MLVAVNVVAAPKFTALFAQRRLDELERLARKNALLMTVVSSPLVLLCLLSPATLLSLFGQEFQSAGNVLVILAVGHLIYLVTGSVRDIMLMTGHEKVLRNNIIIAASMNLVLNAVLIPHFASVGAAIATAISLATLNILSAVDVYTALGVVAIPFLGKNRHS